MNNEDKQMQSIKRDRKLHNIISSEKSPLPVLAEKACGAIRRYKMLDGKKAVIIGLSGGADSTALLLFFCNEYADTGLKIYAAHINHCLRGAEADRDEQFVRKLCQERGVGLFVKRADVRTIAKKTGATVEEAGRRVRYAFFEEKANELGAAVATAHTLSDSIETQLLNFARGTGLRGLCGIPPVRGRIIRPFIRATRRDTEEYCNYNGIKYVDDSTNFNREFTRNRIRLDVVPQLYTVNTAFDAAAARLLSSLEEDEDCLSSLAEKRLAAARISDGVYDAAALTCECPNAVLKRCIMFSAAEFSKRAQDAKHIDAIATALLRKKGKVELAGGSFAEVKDGRLVFFKQRKNPQPEEFSFAFEPGTYRNGKYQLVISPISQLNLKNLKNINKRCFKNAVDCDKIKDNAHIRAKIEGDKISPVGRNVTKTLKKIFNEAKIPVSERPYIPVAADGEGVFWAGEIGVSQRVCVTDGTKNAVLLEIFRLEV